MKTLRKTLIERIKYFREVKGLRQVDLAEAIGKSVGSIAQIETGVFFPSDDTIDKILHEFKVSPSEFFNDPLDTPKPAQKLGQDKVWDTLQAIAESSVKREIVGLLAALDDSQVATHLARLQSELRVGQSIGAKDRKKRVTLRQS